MATRKAVPVSVQRDVIARDAGRCRIPSCRRRLSEVVGPSGQNIVMFFGELAHIRSASPNGPRYDPNYPVEKLNSTENLMCLCPEHNHLVDKYPYHFTPEGMETWISEHPRKPWGWKNFPFKIVKRGHGYLSPEDYAEEFERKKLLREQEEEKRQQELAQFNLSQFVNEQIRNGNWSTVQDEDTKKFMKDLFDQVFPKQ